MTTRSRGRAQRFSDAKLVCMYEALGLISILQNREGKGKQGKKEGKRKGGKKGGKEGGGRKGERRKKGRKKSWKK